MVWVGNDGDARQNFRENERFWRVEKKGGELPSRSLFFWLVWNISSASVCCQQGARLHFSAILASWQSPSASAVALPTDHKSPTSPFTGVSKRGQHLGTPYKGG